MKTDRPKGVGMKRLYAHLVRLMRKPQSSSVGHTGGYLVLDRLIPPVDSDGITAEGGAWRIKQDGGVERPDRQIIADVEGEKP